MVAPVLPKTDDLVEQLREKVDYVLIDKMNYHYADQIYNIHDLEYAMSQTFFNQRKVELSKAFKKEGVPCQLLF